MTRPVRASLALLALLTVSTAQAQGPGLERVMHKKLEVSQQILEAVVTSRWDALTNTSGWSVLKAPEYARHSDAFRAAVRTLRDAAAKRDLDATPKAYVAMTLSCVECHRYLARVRVAGE